VKSIVLDDVSICCVCCLNTFPNASTAYHDAFVSGFISSFTWSFFVADRDCLVCRDSDDDDAVNECIWLFCIENTISRICRSDCLRMDIMIKVTSWIGSYECDWNSVL